MQGRQGLVRVVLMGLMLALTMPAWAEEQQPEAQAAGESEEPGLAQHIGVKVARGLTNFAFGWVEIPKQIYLVGREQGWLAAAVRGPIDGLGMFLSRTVAGMYELFSFPFPIPPHYQPLMQPEFVWQPDAAWPAPSASARADTATESRQPAAP